MVCKKLKTLKECSVCGKEYYPSIRYNRDTCSKKCACKIRSGPSGYQKQKVKCYVCGKELLRSPNHMKKLHHFCSTKCYYSVRSKYTSGVKNPMFGKHHSLKTKHQMSIFKAKNPSNHNTMTSKSCVRKDLKQFFRSSWEANYARYLNFKKIKWEYEKKKFVFHGYQTSPICYVPDFYLPDKDVYVELKGRHQSSDRTKLKRLKKEYPEDFKKFVWLVSSRSKKDIKKIKKIGIKKFVFYDELEIKYRNVIKHWEDTIKAQRIRQKVNYEKRKIKKLSEFIILVLEKLYNDGYYCIPIEPTSDFICVHVIAIKKNKKTRMVKVGTSKSHKEVLLSHLVKFKNKIGGDTTFSIEGWIFDKKTNRFDIIKV